MFELRHSIVYARESLCVLLGAALPEAVCVTSRRDFVRELAKHRTRIAFVDFDLLASIQGESAGIAVIAVVEGALDAIVNVLATHPSVRHAIATAMLGNATTRTSLEQLCERIAQEPEQCALGPAGIGRAALIASSSRREARLDRMREFFETHGVSSRSAAVLGEIGEELILNGLYDAPAEAGYYPGAVIRTDAVELPPELACEISYGIEEGAGFVRVRDPFGSLKRDRLLSVLGRCSRSDVALDESRGGAGLGMWRVFSLSSSVVITVIPGRLTDVLVWIDASKRRAAKHAHTIQLFFPQDHVVDQALGRFAADHDHDLIDDSFTALVGS